MFDLMDVIHNILDNLQTAVGDSTATIIGFWQWYDEVRGNSFPPALSGVLLDVISYMIYGSVPCSLT